MPVFRHQYRSALIALLFAAPASAATLFDESAVIDVTLTGPMGTLIADTEDRSERPFVLAVDGREHRVKVRPRGHSRLRVCNFPPLRLNFRSTDTAESAFDGQDRLKLVTHCRNHDRGEQDMLEEYAAYRIFNALTELSYRVRMLRIRYQDTDGKLDDKASPRYGFVLETADQFAKRTGAVPVTLEGVPKKRHDLDQAALMYVYQYLIANTDWGLVKADYDEGCCHNIDLFERDALVLTVPYDLDLSGIVNASYAFPDIKLRIKKVTQRLYRGLCTDRATLQRAVDKVVSRKDRVVAAVEGTPGLAEDNRRKAVNFLGRFYDKAANRDKFVKSLERRCIGK